MTCQTDRNRILLVDDNEAILEVLTEVFCAQGLEALSANSVQNALIILETEYPEAIVCDVMMPGIDGFEFYRTVSEHPDWHAIPFIFLTGLIAPEEIRFAKELGCDDYVVKPFNPEDLVAVVKGKLKKLQMRKSAMQKKMEDYRRRIIHTLSHEFRTPLVAVNTGAELLREQYGSLEQSRFIELLESVQRGGQRLQRLVEDFMTLQQIDSGIAASASAKFARRVSLVDLAQRAIERFDDYVWGGKAYNIRIAEIEGSHNNFVTRVYEPQVVDAIIRILSNAQKFSNSGTPIDIAFRYSEAKVYLSIRDYGYGLPVEAVQAALAVFAQIGREVTEQQGCGLGLPIAHYFVHINGGEIGFEIPADASGTCVTFSFPRA